MKDGRALYSISQGADEQWAQNYVKKESPWAVLSPVANIVGILASFEAFKLIVRRSSLPPILSPQLIRIDLAHNEMVTVMNPQNGAWNYSEL
ncbi:hypothetical protein [Brevibacillus laterosporus]|uniref:Uncharacterized protein n=1 Tax=Brevibacillus laterosporus TaxID=1465 RepID=A0AAP8QAS0_BRELA|nr:hypothetical protein [Brevibacillus laterosporus]MED1665836.1 hypothetical protein [Brevibacillus laterosporus]MED1671190.1 hypothetical protein [Brevibacillus laterosporus]MED1717139.1 hypothetical protein [Brevibacillus laterosporus]PPA84195.1 hypothetical protein C4A76_17715 [Brevibacillus laterosporus]PPA93714.1 hypothetical protein C4A77_17115 [Brevibacillus laterosporus]